ncbi:class I SAM-dependent methyltransferase, partial [Candidatus Latescibacterota bacterium]
IHMKSLRHLCRSFAVICIVMIAACAVLHDESLDNQYQPRVGQEGKDVVWVPTPQALVDKMLDLAQVTPDDFVIDLGSGDGRTVITAAKRGAHALGIEYNPDMVSLSRHNAEVEGVSDRATFKNADLFETDFSEATVITMFLLPSINLKLRPIILDLKPGTRIVSNTFEMGDWTPDESATIDDITTSWRRAHLWIVPAKVEGNWRMANGELALTQEFQMISGTITNGGSNTTIENGKLYGDQISFDTGDAHYTGRVKGNVIEGVVTIVGTNSTWRATLSGN